MKTGTSRWSRAPRLTARSWLGALARHLAALEERREVVSRIAELENGFEDWLKFEMAALVQGAPWNYEPWLDDVRGDVGVEFRATLRGGGAKLVDVWASPRYRATKWLFAELKVAFNNNNKGKQLRSWVSDMRALRLIDESCKDHQVAGLISLVCAVGFSSKELGIWTGRVLSEEAPTLHVKWARNIKLTDGRMMRMRALIGDG